MLPVRAKQKAALDSLNQLLEKQSPFTDRYKFAKQQISSGKFAFTPYVLTATETKAENHFEVIWIQSKASEVKGVYLATADGVELEKYILSEDQLEQLGNWYKSTMIRVAYFEVKAGEDGGGNRDDDYPALGDDHGHYPVLVIPEGLHMSNLQVGLITGENERTTPIGIWAHPR